MLAIELILIGIYGLLLLFIFAYSFIQLNLVFNYLRYHGKSDTDDDRVLDTSDHDIPHVTIQLPIYNELYVIERLIDAVAAFDYPKEKLEIQVLDDSTDDTVTITAKKVAAVKEALGLDISHVRRDDRKGFKAGALKEGLKTAKGEFVAIFDADFVPKPEFLRRTIPYFTDPEIGVVQTRWEHINKDYSLLTRLQAFGLDAHFSVEQMGRNAHGHFMNFNGTAGVWRKATIEDAGGWESDTLTEDLDLSYRAQVKGWKFKYLENVSSPAELPAAMNALKTQQYRWTKGAAECARKNLLKVWKAQGLQWGTKVHALFHLMNSFLFVCIITTAILSIPLLFIKQDIGEYATYFKYGAVFLFALLFLASFYWVSACRGLKGGWKCLAIFLVKFPMFLSVSMGLSLHNAIAVIEGYAGRKTPFVRTPKFNIKTGKDKWDSNKYLSTKISMMTILEGLLAIYFFGGVLTGLILKDLALLPFHIMLSVGFGLVSYYSFYHAHRINKLRS